MSVTVEPALLAEAESQVRNWRASDGYIVHYRRWVPARRPALGRILALHGIQSHSAWYNWSCGQLCESGYEICFLDRRGGGMNERRRGDAPDAEQLIDDVTRFAAEWRKSAAGSSAAPMVLLGISWGGKLAALAAGREPGLFDGVALLYPGLCARVRATWLQNLRLSLARRLGLHQRKVAIPLDDPRYFTAEPQYRQFIRQDPLSVHEVTVRFLLANRALDRQLLGAGGSLVCPALLMLAGRDQIIENAATRKIFERLAIGSKTIIEYAEAQHTLEFEPDRHRFLADLKNWLAALAGATEPAGKGMPGEAALRAGLATSASPP
jgi:alpha-beta hydrolase superfamily lysophospholipase